LSWNPSWGALHLPAHAIYLDNGASYVTVRHNVAENLQFGEADRLLDKDRDQYGTNRTETAFDGSETVRQAAGLLPG